MYSYTYTYSTTAVDSEDIHEEPSHEPEDKEYFEEESATASVSYDLEVDQSDMQFGIHQNGDSSDSDGVAEGLEEGNYLEAKNQQRRLIVWQKRGPIVKKRGLIRRREG